MAEVISAAESKTYTIISSRDGYQIQISDADRFQLLEELRESNVESIVDSGDIEKTILLYLLSIHSATIDEIAENLHCSRNTVFNKIKTVKQELQNHQLELESKPHQGYKVIGNEFSVRRCFAAHFSKENLFLQLEMKRLFHKDIDYDWLLSMFTAELKRFSLRKSTEEVKLFLKYMLISALRQNKIKEPIDFQEESLNITHLRVTSQVLENFLQEYLFKFNQEEHLFLTMVLGGGSVVPSERERINTSVDEVIKRIAFEFKEQFNRETSLKESLTAHIISTYKRLKLGVTIKNPLKDLIQSRYFMATYYAYILAEELNKTLDISMDDHEVSYLALHFEANMEGNGLLNKFNVLVVCGGGVGTSTVLKHKLESNFPQLHIVEVLPYYMLRNRDLSNIDFIIATNTFEMETDIKVIHVNPILNEKDSERILETIRNGASNDHIKNLFSKNLFFTNLDFKNRDECLLFLTNHLIKDGIIEEKIQNEVLLREENAPTELGHLTAIPHCLTNQESRIVVLILNEPIQWKSEKVQLIFFGCINPKEQQSKKYFPQIYKKVSQTTWVNEVISSKKFDTFIKRLTM